MPFLPPRNMTVMKALHRNMSKFMERMGPKMQLPLTQGDVSAALDELYNIFSAAVALANEAPANNTDEITMLTIKMALVDSIRQDANTVQVVADVIATMQGTLYKEFKDQLYVFMSIFSIQDT